MPASPEAVLESKELALREAGEKFADQSRRQSLSGSFDRLVESNMELTAAVRVFVKDVKIIYVLLGLALFIMGLFEWDIKRELRELRGDIHSLIEKK